MIVDNGGLEWDRRCAIVDSGGENVARRAVRVSSAFARNPYTAAGDQPTVCVCPSSAVTV
ncbi:hypothetical protein [Halomontanus rarus]|uniref:hypothetical protein n=1 Tax=Halomontanus rarus TaxID=3034020 RepID=UPI002FF890D3